MRHIPYFSSFPGFFSLTLGHVITPEAFLQDCSLTEEPEIPHSTDSSLRSHSCPWITRPSETFHKAVKSKPGQKESKGSRYAQGSTLDKSSAVSIYTSNSKCMSKISDRRKIAQSLPKSWTKKVHEESAAIVSRNKQDMRQVLPK